MVVSVSMMETTSKNILYVSHIIISTIASSRSGLLEESSFVEDLLKKHYSEDSTMPSLARAIFDFSMADKKQFLNFIRMGREFKTHICLEDQVFNAFISGQKSIVPVSFEKAAGNTNTQATNI